MSTIEYPRFEEIDLNELMLILNDDSIRSHLVEHPYFNAKTIKLWVREKIETDLEKGCKIRAVLIDGELSGWCGIQPDENGFEIAIVISKKYWGFGISIFKTLIEWARNLGHKEILFHLLDSRREYNSLTKKSTKVRHSMIMGRSFTTYYFPLSAVA